MGIMATETQITTKQITATIKQKVHAFGAMSPYILKGTVQVIYTRQL